MLLLGGGGGVRSFTPSFASQQTFATGATPISVTTADLNGDGKPDLIVAKEEARPPTERLTLTRQCWMFGW